MEIESDLRELELIIINNDMTYQEFESDYFDDTICPGDIICDCGDIICGCNFTFC